MSIQPNRRYHCEFLKDDVLLNERDRIRRMADLYKAAAIYTTSGTEVALTLVCNGKPETIETAVMATGSRTVMCSGGRSFPVAAIKAVEFR